MSDGSPAPKALPDSQALLGAKGQVTGAVGEGDAALIARIENSIQHSRIANSGLARMMNLVQSRVGSERATANAKVSEHKSEISKNAKDAPPDAGAPPNLAPATTPSVKTSGGGPKGAAPAGKTAVAGGGGKAVGKGVGKATGKGGAAKREAGPAVDTPDHAAVVMSGATDDAQLMGMLNAYSPKSPEPTEMIGRIGQMKNVAQGFYGQLDTYVSQGNVLDNALAGASNFLGVGSNVAAVWDNNPYRRMSGVVAGVMTAVSAIRNVASAVGGVLGTVGLLLTVVGLLGMIFPPIGVAVSGVARLISAIGLICDIIGFVLGAVLMGFNGILLAQQITAGASAEEKAATAELLMTEANNTAGSIMSLGLQFGPRFMTGLLKSSKGVVQSLFRQARAVVGRVTLRLTAPIRNLANRLMRRVGLGGSRVGIDKLGAGGKLTTWKETTLSRWRNAPGKAIAGRVDKVQDFLMTRYGSGKVAKWLDNVGTSAGGLGKKLDAGELAEGLGKGVGGAGAGTALGRRWAARADAAELATMKIKLKYEQADNAHLTESRWRAEYGRRGDTGGQINSQTKARLKTLQDHHKREIDELKIQANVADPPWTSDTVKRTHDSRKERWDRERLFEGKAPDAELLRLRTDNLALEKKLQTRAGFVMPEVHTWNDIQTYASAVYQVTDAFAVLSLVEGDTSWDKADRASLRKQAKYNKGGATGVAGSAGGSSTYAEIRAARLNQEREEFRAFVALRRPTANTAASARSMLSSVLAMSTAGRTAGTGAAVGAVNGGATTTPATATPGTTPATTGTTSTSTVPATAPATTPAATTTPGSTATTGTTTASTTVPDPTPPAAPASTPGQALESAAADALPYWPSLIADYDRGLADFGYMRRVATDFKRAQIVGKQKAVETIDVYGRYEEYVQKRAELAAKNKQGADQTKGNAGDNAAKAGTSEQKGAEAANKQEGARGQATVGVPSIPEPDEKGFWARIVGQIKRFVRAQAARIFGAIQEWIASAILQYMCGVSMGDLRDYAGALRRQQMAASTMAGTASTQSTQAQQQNVQLEGRVHREVQSAIGSIAECDRNIGDADQFLSDVQAFEQQLAQEKAHAQQFIAQVIQAVHVEQARQRAEESQQRLADTTEAFADGDVSIGTMAGAMAGNAMAQDNLDEAREQQQNENARTQITTTAGYVSQSAEQMKAHVEIRKVDYDNQLRAARVNRTGDDAHGDDVLGPTRHESRDIVSEFKAFADAAKEDMSATSTRVIDSDSAVSIADHVITVAASLDVHFNDALSGLDTLYERTYELLRNGERKLDANGSIADQASDATSDALVNTFGPVVAAADRGLNYLLQPMFGGPGYDSDQQKPATTVAANP